MKTLLFILLLLPLIGNGQVYSTKNLFALWGEYLTDCNELVPDTIKQDGVVNVKYKPVIVNGEVSHYILSPVDTVWSDCKCGKYADYDSELFTIRSGSSWTYSTLTNYTNASSIAYTPSEQVNNKINITRNKICHIKKRKATWSDFWDKWLVERKVIEMN